MTLVGSIFVWWWRVKSRPQGWFVMSLRLI